MNAVSLLSSGLDSSVALAMALDAGIKVPLCLTVDYGQKASRQEQAHAAQIAKYFGLKHQILNLEWMSKFPSGLTSAELQVPQLKSTELDDPELTIASAAKVWVPNRNGILLEIAAGFAESLQVGHVITGFNKEEAATFPDNSAEYLASLNQTLKFSTRNHVEVISPTLEMNKTQIVEWARRHHFPFQYLWSCYFSEEKMCGKCESCQRLKRALGEEEFNSL